MSTSTSNIMTSSQGGAPVSPLDGRFEFADQIEVEVKMTNGQPLPYNAKRWLTLLRDKRTNKEYLLISNDRAGETVVPLG